MARTAHLGTLLVNVGATTGPLNAALAQGRGQLRVFATSVPSVLSSLTGLSTGFLGVSLGALAAGRGIGRLVGINREFAREMARSTAIMGNISDSMRSDLAQQARAVSYSTQFTAAQGAQAYRFLTSSGLNAAQSLAALPVVAKFAQAGIMDLDTATNHLADSQGALGLKVTDSMQNMRNMQRVADVLTKANDLAQGSVEDFALALSTKSAGSMRLYNVSVEEGVAVLAALADQGVKGEEAGTQFSIVLRDLTTKALQNADAFKAAELAVYDSQGALRNMADIVGDLEKKLAPLSVQARKALLLDLGFSDRSQGTLQQLLGTSEKIRRFQAELQKAGGHTDEIARKNMPAFERALNRVRAAFDQLATKVGAPILDGFASAVLKITDSLASTETNVIGVTAKVLAFSAAFGVTLLVFPKIVAGIRAIVTALRTMAIAQSFVTALSGPMGLATLAAGMAAGTVAAGLLDMAFDKLNTKLADASNAVAQASQDAGKQGQQAAAAVEEATQKIDDQSKKVAEWQKQIAEMGKRVADDVRTPAEIAAERLKHLSSLLDAQAITWETYRRAVAKANEELLEASQREAQDNRRTENAAVTKGSTAAFSAIQSSKAEMERVAAVNRAQLQAQKDANAILEKISTNTGKDPIILRTADID